MRKHIKVWLPCLIIILLALAFCADQQGLMPLSTLWAKPKPYQEVADALAELGWIVKDIEVDEAQRIVRVAAIPPEDDEQYVAGFYYLLEWVSPLIEPPFDENGYPIKGVYPGALFVFELTADGPQVLLPNDKSTQAYGITKILAVTWEGAHLFLSEDTNGRPWREFFTTAEMIHAGLSQLSWFGAAYYYEYYPAPDAYQPFDNGWYACPEKTEEAPSS